MTRVFAAVLLIGAVLAGACAPAAPAASSPTGNQPKKGGTLILVRAGEVTNLDPHKVPAFTSARVFELVYSYLMRLDENLVTWTSQPGNSSIPPTTIPLYMAVIVSSSIQKSGSAITGNVRGIVVVRTNPGYGTSPGKTGTGQIVAILCSSP